MRGDDDDSEGVVPLRERCGKGLMPYPRGICGVRRESVTAKENGQETAKAAGDGALGESTMANGPHLCQGGEETGEKMPGKVKMAVEPGPPFGSDSEETGENKANEHLRHDGEGERERVAREENSREIDESTGESEGI